MASTPACMSFARSERTLHTSSVNTSAPERKLRGFFVSERAFRRGPLLPATNDRLRSTGSKCVCQLRRIDCPNLPFRYRPTPTARGGRRDSIGHTFAFGLSRYPLRYAIDLLGSDSRRQRRRSRNVSGRGLAAFDNVRQRSPQKAEADRAARKRHRANTNRAIAHTKAGAAARWAFLQNADWRANPPTMVARLASPRARGTPTKR